MAILSLSLSTVHRSPAWTIEMKWPKLNTKKKKLHSSIQSKAMSCIDKWCSRKSKVFHRWVCRVDIGLIHTYAIFFGSLLFAPFLRIPINKSYITFFTFFTYCMKSICCNNFVWLTTNAKTTKKITFVKSFYAGARVNFTKFLFVRRIYGIHVYLTIVPDLRNSIILMFFLLMMRKSQLFLVFFFVFWREVSADWNYIGATLSVYTLKWRLNVISDTPSAGFLQQLNGSGCAEFHWNWTNNIDLSL